ncbi:MAG: hypothetical protein L5657_03340 [Calditerricola sp.]|jgi:hypothetical protein|nr:hypothetical protein [Calditerricola sp.]
MVIRHPFGVPARMRVPNIGSPAGAPEIQPPGRIEVSPPEQPDRVIPDRDTDRPAREQS